MPNLSKISSTVPVVAKEKLYDCVGPIGLRRKLLKLDPLSV